jgi:hypothetical protein
MQRLQQQLRNIKLALIPASQLAGIGALAYGVSKKKGGVINEGIDALAMRKAKRGAKK